MRVPEESEKRVTWAELFFDLVFVFAVTQVSALLHHDPSWAGAGRALIVFVPVWWAWVGTTVHANRHDVDNPRDILGIFALGLGSLGLALAVPQAYAERGWLFGAAYLFLRLVLGVLVFRDWRGIATRSASVPSSPARSCWPAGSPTVPPGLSCGPWPRPPTW
jgi:low temperature requirement protein LtrA